VNIVDIVLAILLLTGLIRGFLKGFIYEIAVLGALFLGTYAAFRFSWFLQPYVSKWIHSNPATVVYVSSLLMFLLVAVGIFFLAKLFEGLVNIAALGIFNKIMGALFGLFKYAFVISVLLYFFNQFDVKRNFISADKKAESKLYYPLLKMSQVLIPLMKEMKELDKNQSSSTAFTPGSTLPSKYSSSAPPPVET
jgi:membrane protein required for colicin V production